MKIRLATMMSALGHVSLGAGERGGVLGPFGGGVDGDGQAGEVLGQARRDARRRGRRHGRRG